MRLGWVGAAMTLGLAACSSDSSDHARLCRQWDKADEMAEAAADDYPAEVSKLADMLPDEYKPDAALLYYPHAGDVPDDADASMAIEAGERLEKFRRDACDRRND